MSRRSNTSTRTVATIHRGILLKSTRRAAPVKIHVELSSACLHFQPGARSQTRGVTCHLHSGRTWQLEQSSSERYSYCTSAQQRRSGRNTTRLATGADVLSSQQWNCLCNIVEVGAERSLIVRPASAPPYFAEHLLGCPTETQRHSVFDTVTKVRGLYRASRPASYDRYTVRSSSGGGVAGNGNAS